MQVADRIVVLTDGRLVADGSGAQIKARVAGRTIAVATAGLIPPPCLRCPGC